MTTTDHFDVTVVGGGSAGLAAALSAARAGARTLLVERQALLGGMGSNAMVHTFCGLFHPDVSRGPQWLNPGIPTELGQALMQRSCLSAPDLMGRVFVLRHRPEDLASLAAEWCAAEPLLTVQTNSELTAIEPGWRLTINQRSVQTRAVIDTTGDAMLARLLGESHWEIAASARLYRPAYVWSFDGLRGELDEPLKLQIAALIVRAVRDGALPPAALGAALRASPKPGEVFVTIDMEAGAANWNPLDHDQRSSLEDEGRATARELWQFLRSRHEAFAAIEPPVFPAQAGIRESARWRGDYLLTAADLLSSRRFENEAALAGWPLEIRETARGPKFRYFEKPEPAGIPDECLKTSALPGLFFAGRCLSCDHEALASVRVMGTCLATGQAAGRLAVS
jgi:glycine/D-amino acid oxidase-like deaminating enzyme